MGAVTLEGLIARMTPEEIRRFASIQTEAVRRRIADITGSRDLAALPRAPRAQRSP